MTADELLLQWAKEQAPEWLDKEMQRTVRNHPYVVDQMGVMSSKIYGATCEHIKHCGPKIYAVNHEWECGCYSEYTRDDDWMVHTYVRCRHGLTVEMRLRVDVWQMPDVIQRLAELDPGCAYDDPDH